MRKQFYYWIVAALVSVFVGISCTSPAPIPTSQNVADIDATVRVSIEQTTVANGALESTIAAAVEATHKAESDQAPTARPSVQEPTTVPIPILTAPTASPVVLPTPAPTETPVPTATSVPPSPTAVPTLSLTSTPSPTPTVVPTSTPSATPVPKVLSLEELLDEVKGSVVQIVTDKGRGSGVIIEVDGSNGALILTNQHVIDEASTIDLVYSEQTTYSGTLVGVDSLRDLAVLRICCDSSFAPLAYSNPDDVKLGTTVIALGFPLGVDSLRVSQGIVSGIQFNPDEHRNELQTDASINPGNSGGPLLLLDGTIAGINTYVIRASSDGVTVEGFGFAVASQTLESFVPPLVAGQVVAAPTPHPSMIGVDYIDPTHGFKITPPSGWLIESTADGVIMWDEYAGSTIVVSAEYQGAQYQTTSQFTDDWGLGAAGSWTDFVIESEQNVFRMSADGVISIAGREFVTRFTEKGIRYESLTHWFVQNGWLFKAFLKTPTDVSRLTEYSQLRLEQQLAFVSFRPPGV